MSTLRYFILICHAGSFGLLGSACAGHPALVPARYTASEGLQSIELESGGGALGSTPSPYIPKRDSNGSHYSWQSETVLKCAADTKPLVLTFSGSVGVFPLLSDEELERAEAAALVQPLAASAQQPAHDKRASNPDLVVARLRPRFRRCFSNWLAARSDAEGSVRLTLELGCFGNVQAITADVRGVDEPTLACVFNAVGPAQFDPPADGHATIQIPVVFKNAAR
jgi:hypothetical protein